jgi:hypothetical protein
MRSCPTVDVDKVGEHGAYSESISPQYLRPCGALPTSEASSLPIPVPLKLVPTGRGLLRRLPLSVRRSSWTELGGSVAMRRARRRPVLVASGVFVAGARARAALQVRPQWSEQPVRVAGVRKTSGKRAKHKTTGTSSSVARSATCCRRAVSSPLCAYQALPFEHGWSAESDLEQGARKRTVTRKQRSCRGPGPRARRRRVPHRVHAPAAGIRSGVLVSRAGVCARLVAIS